ncbi:MAG: ester cyclase [Chloroflexota bacterium]
MSTEEMKALARRWWGMEDFKGVPETEIAETTRKVISEIFAKEWIAHSPDSDMTFERYIEYNAAYMTAFPDVKFTIEDMIAEGDKVAIRYTMRGTHKGPYRGMPATGKKIEVGGISIGRVAGGKFVEGWSCPDRLGMMQQLGVIPRQ